MVYPIYLIALPGTLALWGRGMKGEKYPALEELSSLKSQASIPLQSVSTDLITLSHDLWTDSHNPPIEMTVLHPFTGTVTAGGANMQETQLGLG